LIGNEKAFFKILKRIVCKQWENIIVFGSMTNITILNRKMSPELARNMHFCYGSDIAVNRAD